MYRLSEQAFSGCNIYLGLAFLAALGMATTVILVRGILIDWLVLRVSQAVPWAKVQVLTNGDGKAIVMC